jgi:putative NIF3 family GTP cyclohydrolase 1 type 2
MKAIALILIPAAAVVCFAQAGKKPITAKEVIERIQKNVGVPWSHDTVDTFKAGNPDTPVTGIVTTFMATFDVLERAAASGKNLIISHEPTFYSHLDKTAGFENDPVYKAKQAFIEKHHLVVWRFHDHWHMHYPDGIMVGMTKALGWEKYRVSENGPFYTLPETTLGALAANVRDRLKIRTLRVIGDPAMKVTKVGFSPGASGPEGHIQLLRRDDVEALLIGEVPEWESIAYVRDAVAEGKHKAMVILGHVPSEESGMNECARWLKTFISEVPVEYMPAGEPFWTPR